MDIAARFPHLVEVAVKHTETIPSNEMENILLWPEADAIIRFAGQEDAYTSIAVESEKHNVYAYWAPNFQPIFLDCEEEDFVNFANMVEGLN